MIELDVMIEAGGWSALGDVEAAMSRAAEAAVAAAPAVPDGPLAATLLLADDSAIRELNRLWRGRDSSTNVLSFPSSSPPPPGEPRHLGDIALAFETLVREAGEEGKSLTDHATHLVVHGVLHLLGQDHETENDAEAMEGVERAALASLGIPDPYPGEHLAPA